MVYVVIGLIDFRSAVLLGAVASGFHVTRQSIGVQRLYSQAINVFYEYITYAASFFFIFIQLYYGGFIPLYLLILGLNIG